MNVIDVMLHCVECSCVDFNVVICRTSNWDYLNTEKNAARLDLYKCENWCETSNVS